MSWRQQQNTYDMLFSSRFDDSSRHHLKSELGPDFHVPDRDLRDLNRRNRTSGDARTPSYPTAIRSGVGRPGQRCRVEGGGGEGGANFFDGRRFGRRGGGGFRGIVRISGGVPGGRGRAVQGFLSVALRRHHPEYKKQSRYIINVR